MQWTVFRYEVPQEILDVVRMTDDLVELSDGSKWNRKTKRKCGLRNNYWEWYALPTIQSDRDALLV